MISVSRRDIVCLCGSTRFKPAFEEVARQLTVNGAIILMPHAWGQWDGTIAQDSALKDRMDELHLDKIRLAKRIFVVNPNGYVGTSTRAEIAAARGWGLPVEFLRPPTSEASPFAEGDVAQVVGGPVDLQFINCRFMVKRIAGMGLVILDCPALGPQGELAIPPASLLRVK